ncbi:MAG: hypothetical protein FWC97_02680 [Treponema sp.]|nr:hypothetical protein [Treponema sp.]
MSSSHRDYVPQNPAQFNVFMQNLLDYLSNKTSHWGSYPPSGRIAELQESYNACQAAFHSAIETPTPANRLRRNETQAETVKELRSFVNQFLRFEPVTNADRLEMGIPNHDNTRTDHKVVTEMVDHVLHLRNIREIMVDFWVQGQSGKAKPKGYDGAVLIWGILDTPPQHTDELIHHALASRTPFALHFEETERGKTVYVAACWQNDRGITGQWSEFKSAVIP